MTGDPMLHPNPERLQGYVEETLAAAERAVLESHLLGCDTCRNEVEEFRSLFAALSTLPQFAPSVHFADHVMASVKLPDPWYVRALAKTGDRLAVLAPRTTSGCAFATAFLALPFALFGALATWLLSKPYMTPSNMFAFVVHRGSELLGSATQAVLAYLLQTDVALYLAGQFEAITAAGVGTAGALLAGVAVATAGSSWILYQNLFRANAHRNEHYVSYSF